MRKVFLLIALVTTVFASNACEKKDDTKPQEQPKNSLEQKLIGKWKITGIGLEFLPNGRGREIGYTTQNAKDCIPDDKFKVDEILFTWNIIGNDFI